MLRILGCGLVVLSALSGAACVEVPSIEEGTLKITIEGIDANAEEVECTVEDSGGEVSETRSTAALIGGSAELVYELLPEGAYSVTVESRDESGALQTATQDEVVVTAREHAEITVDLGG